MAVIVTDNRTYLEKAMQKDVHVFGHADDSQQLEWNWTSEREIRSVTSARKYVRSECRGSLRGINTALEDGDLPPASI
jgi:hypothetical protein